MRQVFKWLIFWFIIQTPMLALAFGEQANLYRLNDLGEFVPYVKTVSNNKLEVLGFYISKNDTLSKSILIPENTSVFINNKMVYFANSPAKLNLNKKIINAYSANNDSVFVVLYNGSGILNTIQLKNQSNNNTHIVELNQLPIKPRLVPDNSYLNLLSLAFTGFIVLVLRFGGNKPLRVALAFTQSLKEYVDHYRKIGRQYLPRILILLGLSFVPLLWFINNYGRLPKAQELIMQMALFLVLLFAKFILLQVADAIFGMKGLANIHFFEFLKTLVLLLLLMFVFSWRLILAPAVVASTLKFDSILVIAWLIALALMSLILFRLAGGYYKQSKVFFSSYLLVTEIIPLVIFFKTINFVY